MHIRQIQRLTANPALSPAKTVRIYLFTCLSAEHPDFLPVLREQIKEKLHCSEDELQSLLRQQEEKWSARVDRCEELLKNSDWMQKFASRFSRLDNRHIDQDKAVFLMTGLLSGVLQNASVLSYSNHLHRKDVLCLLSMLENPAFLKPLTKQIEKPVFDCARGQYPPFSEEYVDRILALMHNLAAYYLCALAYGRGGMLCTIEGAIRSVSRMSLAETACFLNPPRAESLQQEAASTSEERSQIHREKEPSSGC